MSKINVFLIIIIIVIICVFLELNRDYVIGKVISVDDTGCNAVIEKQSSSFGLSNGIYSIHSSEPLKIDDIIKIKFKYSPFEQHTIKASSPAEFSQDYYVEKMSQ